jgi:three-Cys-motif partner protein
VGRLAVARVGKKKRRTQSDRNTLLLFPDLQPPPPISEMVELRNLRHPVWTEQKAKLIARYLQLFTYVTRHGTYIDGFAGQQNATAVDGWAAQLVLNNRPWRLRRYYLCDNDPRQIAVLKKLVATQPQKERADSKREIEIIPGDFNLTVRSILDSRKLDPATFCLLDQRTFECKWSTVEAVAHHRAVGNKIEMFYFLPIGWLNRAMIATTTNRREIETWWGRPDWEQLVDLPHHKKAAAFMERFRELGYKQVVAFPIFDRSNGDRIMFYMILASDHAEAPKLMWRAYDQAVHDIEGWQQLALINGAAPTDAPTPKRRGKRAKK